MIAPTDVLISRMERRTAYLLAGLREPDATISKWGVDGTSTVIEQPPLPSGRELLAQFLEEGRSLDDRAVRVAREAAIAELLLTGQEERGPE